MTSTLRRGFARSLVTIFMFSVVVGVQVVPANANHYVSYYPLSGDLWYDGEFTADSLFRWDRVGWNTTTPGYEHDLILDPDYLNVCTSWTQLPFAYDDCGTAGYFEPSDTQWAFAFGTYRLNQVANNTFYWGGWDFNSGWSLGSPVRLRGQEVYKSWCTFDNVWCMGSYQTTPPLIGGTWEWLQTRYATWYHSH